MEGGVARNTLGRAYFFLNEAVLVGTSSREAFQSHLEAAIVFARSVTFHLQKEYSRRPGFSDWYAMKQKLLKESPVARFLLESRNHILKEGAVPVSKNVNISISGQILISGSARVVVHRGRPWYRRTVKTLVEDALRPFRQWRHERTERVRLQQLAMQALARPDAVVSSAMHFADPAWNDRPATDIVREFLKMLDDIVLEAENAFERQSSGSA